MSEGKGPSDAATAEREKWVDLLAGMKFFTELSRSDIGLLLTVGQVLRVPFHEYVFKEGTREDAFYVILRGKVKIIKLDSVKHKRESGELSAGSCVGEVGLLLHDERTASILAAEESFVFRFTKGDLEGLPDKTKAGIYRAFATHLALRLKETTDSLVKPTGGVRATLDTAKKE